MEFAATGELVVGPLVLLLHRDTGGCGGSHGFGFFFPIGRDRLDAPDVSALFESQAYDPVFSFAANRNAVSNPRIHFHAGGKLIELDLGSRFERPRKAHAASSRIDHQRATALAEANAAEAQGNLGADASTAAFGGAGGRVHFLSL